MNYLTGEGSKDERRGGRESERGESYSVTISFTTSIPIEEQEPAMQRQRFSRSIFAMDSSLCLILAIS